MSRMGKTVEEISQFKYLVMKVIGGGEDDVSKWVEAQEIGDYGLLGGLAGVGYSCLCGEGGGVVRWLEEKSAIGSRYGAIGGICVDNRLNQYYHCKIKMY